MCARVAKLEKFHPTSEYFDINEFPFYWVARLNAKYAMEMEKTLKPLGMDISRWRVAMLIKVHGQLSISDIAQHAIGRLPTITKIVYRMRDEGFVEVNVSELDGRVTVVTLTDEGYEKLETALQAVSRKVFANAFQGFTEPQIKKTTELLSRLFNNLAED